MNSDKSLVVPSLSAVLVVVLLTWTPILLAGGTPSELQAEGVTYFHAGQYEKAVEVLQEARRGLPDSSDCALWLARAFGRLAERSSWLRALAYARETRKYLELAVELGPDNREALLDLQEYYLKAPQFLGGSVHKAEELGQRLKALGLAGSE